MDKVELERNGRPLHIRSGHTPVNIGLLFGAMLAAALAFGFSPTRSAAVDRVLWTWAAWTFYGVLFASSALTLSAIWRPLPHRLDARTYRMIVNRLIRERIGLLGVAGIMACFSAASIANSAAGTTGAALLLGIGSGLVLRARQTVEDVNKLHEAVRSGDQVDRRYLSDPDGSRE